MKQQIHKAVVAAGLVFATAGASAQLVASVKVEPATVRAGQQATVTVQFDVLGGTNCGLRLHWGDGSTTDYKINQAKDVPLVVQHQWARAGTFQVKAEGKTQGLVPKCGGQTQVAQLVVQAGAAAAAAPAKPGTQPAGNATMAQKSPCPAGWTLVKPGVGKNGAYTCSAKADTPAPAPRPACPGDLTYFENTRRGQLGCRT